VHEKCNASEKKGKSMADLNSCANKKIEFVRFELVHVKSNTGNGFELERNDEATSALPTDLTVTFLVDNFIYIYICIPF
jgi:hypothetical protein